MHSLLCILLLISINVKLIKGLTVELIYRNSPQSPFYNASATPEDLSINAATRSLARYRNYYNQNKLQSTVIPGDGDYLMKFSVGTPPVEQFAVLDTGSDLIWIQCEPCTSCYEQDAPFFDPSQSSTYSNNVPCTSDACSALPRSGCGQTNNQCLYDYRYGDDSYTNGELATDTFTFDGQSNTEFPGTVFGCGHINGGLFSSQGSGLVGLGQGDLSLNSQLANTIHNKFAYCLVPVRSGLNSKLKFGEDADLVSASNVVSTPMLSHGNRPYYYLNLDAVTVGGNTIQNNVQVESGSGNIIIDSGTTLNILNSALYGDLEEAVRVTVGLNSVEHPKYRLCYQTESLFAVPEIKMTFHFTGADVILNTINIFRNVGNGLSCLSMIPSDDGIDIYGNRAQINFQIEYDLGANKVSFAPADCTQF
ncbi:putative aspartic protease At2g35615 [Apium graveolens]|uniref:putative aspartic protease At2g35615 n=1 Tax=Apium graveolens TaxID=4045 RepID=UPI003D7BDE04